MIRGIITDIDGVIIGDKIGYNSPFPHPDVTSRIKQIHASGIPVTLCTGKPHYAVEKIITDCALNTPHITDGGAIIIDPITNTIIQKHVIEKSLVMKVVSAYLNATMYTEIYTQHGYYIQKNQYREVLTNAHTHVLQTPPIIIDDLLQIAATEEIIKVMPIAIDENDTLRLRTIFAAFADRLTLSVASHPVAAPHQFGLITKKSVSKKQAAIDVSTALHIKLSECLGVGDSTSDWNFMELCGSVATVENATEELKRLVTAKTTGGFIGPSVDENGILPILEHFAL
ncbi:MAG: HAD-IIB family hydrolase [Patescibacteria group bacterium]